MLHAGEILVFLSKYENSRGVMPLAEIFSRVLGKTLRVTRFGNRLSKCFPWLALNPVDAKTGMQRILHDTMKCQKPCMLIADWGNPDGTLKNVLKEAVSSNVPAAVIRRENRDGVRRIFVPIVDEEQSVHQLAVANAMARELQVPIKISIVVEPLGMENAAALANLQALSLARAQMLGIRDEPIEIKESRDAVATIKSQFRSGDLVVLAAPNSWRYIENIEATWPALLLSEIGDCLLYMPPKISPFGLGEIFGGSVCMNGVPDNKMELATGLIETLVQRQQIPLGWKQMLIDKIQDENCCAAETADCESVFWRVDLPGLCHFTSCLGVLREDMAGIKLAFLFLTPDGLCGEYLEALTKLSRLILMPRVRQEMASCHTAAEALRILDLDSL